MREDRTIVPVPAPDFQRIDNRIPKLAMMTIDTPRGQIVADEVPGLLTMDFKRPNGATTVGILLYRLIPNVGMIAQLNVASARRTGESLIALCDAIDAEAAKAKEAAEHAGEAS